MKSFRALANQKQAKINAGFFKTGKGEYGEGDKFLGMTMGVIRNFAKQHFHLNEKELLLLLRSEYHEERTFAVLIMVERYKKEPEYIYKLYMANTKNINNWDLVDSSAHKIVGPYLELKSKAPLTKLSKSKSLWERRIAIVATWYYISKNKVNETFRIAKILVNDKHDLIHKATGWMLREAGKKNVQAEEEFLKIHYKTMPRTMLRYAIERFPEVKRLAYLKGTL